MYQSDAMSQNTLHVNDMLVRIFKIILVALAAAAILKAAGILTLPWLYLGTLLGADALACLLSIVCRHFRLESGTLEYINVYCAAVLFSSGYIYLGLNGILLLIVPIGFACLYFDTKLIRQSALLSIIVFILGETFQLSNGWGFNAAELGEYARIGIYIVQFAVIAVLLMTIAKRADNILTNTHSFYENINNIFSNANASSQNLSKAEDILLEGVSLLSFNGEKGEEFSTAAEEDAAAPNTKVKSILSNLNRSMENAKEIMKYTQALLKGPEGKGKELKPGDELVKLEEYNKNSKELIVNLAKYTDRIKEDLSLISVIIDESKLLSINAGAEAENASSGGRGSAILAMKVEKLADESVKSASHIQELLDNVVNDAENTVKSVADTYEEVFKSLELINRTVETLIQWLMYKNMK